MATIANSASVTTIDESHPFFLHYRENPGAILVAQPLVNDNYASWAKSMQRVLGAKRKLGFIDGSLSLTPSMEKKSITCSSLDQVQQHGCILDIKLYFSKDSCECCLEEHCFKGLD